MKHKIIEIFSNKKEIRKNKRFLIAKQYVCLAIFLCERLQTEGVSVC